MTAAAEIIGVDCASETLDLDELRALWRQRFRTRLRSALPGTATTALAWRLQARRWAGLIPRATRLLRRRGRVQAEGFELGVGARLRRDWRGTVFEVVVEESDGFRCNDRIYPSLSAAATAIAGSRWNGPRFFGLRRPGS